MKRRYFARLPLLLPNYAQDQPTYIMLGKWCHMYSKKYDMWFAIVPGPEDPFLLNRPNTEMREITWQEMYNACGDRLRLEEWEERIGFRLKPIALKLIKTLKFLGKIKWLNQLAHLDDEDSPEWWRERQQPQMGVGYGPKEGMG